MTRMWNLMICLVLCVPALIPLVGCSGGGLFGGNDGQPPPVATESIAAMERQLDAMQAQIDAEKAKAAAAEARADAAAEDAQAAVDRAAALVASATTESERVAAAAAEREAAAKRDAATRARTEAVSTTADVTKWQRMKDDIEKYVAVGKTTLNVTPLPDGTFDFSAASAVVGGAVGGPWGLAITAIGGLAAAAFGAYQRTQRTKDNRSVAQALDTASLQNPEVNRTLTDNWSKIEATVTPEVRKTLNEHNYISDTTTPSK